jgi:hypothetical protein
VAGLAREPDPELRARLGPELHDHVRRLVAEATERCAAEVGRVRHARAVEDAAALVEGHPGPVLLLAPDVPRLSREHLDAALDDLAGGAITAFAPGMDGRPFLLAFPDAASLELLAGGVDGLAEATRAAGGLIGMVRPERRLATLGDARAYAADPLTPPELRALLKAAA